MASSLKAVEAFKNQLKKIPSNQVENKLSQLQASMETKIHGIDNPQEANQQNTRIFQTVMEELEQRNLETASLLKSSEKNRLEMEEIIKERNKEIISLRANTLVMYSLDDGVVALNSKTSELYSNIYQLEQDISASKKQEKILHKRIKELNQKEQQRSSDYNEKVIDLTKKLAWAEDQVADRDGLVEKTEKTLKELFETCEKLGDDNNNGKNELHNCLLAGSNMKDANKNLQYCKEYLEEQVDHMVKDLKSTKADNEKLKLEIANTSADNQNHLKKFSLLSEKAEEHKEEEILLTEQLKGARNLITDYESGELKSVVVVNEIKKERQANETEANLLQTKIFDFVHEIENIDEKVKKTIILEKRMDTRLSEMEMRVSNYLENYIEAHELQKIKKELQVKHKLDMNTQRGRVNAVLHNDQADLIKTMKETLFQKKGSKDSDSMPDLKFTYFSI